MILKEIWRFHEDPSIHMPAIANLSLHWTLWENSFFAPSGHKFWQNLLKLHQKIPHVILNIWFRGHDRVRGHIIKSPTTKWVRGLIAFTPFLIIIFFLPSSAINLCEKIRKDDSMDQNQILHDDRSIFWEDLYLFEILKMAAISKWPPLKEGYPKNFKC